MLYMTVDRARGVEEAQVPSGRALGDCVTEEVVTVAERMSAILLRFSFPRSP